MEIRVERYHIYRASHLLNVASSVWNSSRWFWQEGRARGWGKGEESLWSPHQVKEQELSFCAAMSAVSLSSPLSVLIVLFFLWF